MHLFNAERTSVYAPSAMVATSQPLASQVGLDVLKNGGNAADAAIAIAAMVNVLEPMMTGIGGDVFAMVYWHDEKKPVGLNASGIQPRRLTQEYFKRKGCSFIPQAGFESVNIPGAFDGWVELHARYGSKPFASLLEPAIHYARDGFPVGEKIAQFWEYGASKLRLFPDSSMAYLKNGKAPLAGELFRQPELGKTLQLLAHGGREAFYKGQIAEQIIAYFEAHGGGILDQEDFRAQKCEWVTPISAPYRGYDLFEIPPNGQGLVALEAMQILEGFPLGSIDPVSYDVFGSGIVPAGTGIVLNNRGCELSLDPNSPNRVEPNKRPLHSIIPAMLCQKGELLMTFGCMGGNMQPQGHVQILSNLIDRKMHLQQALNAPRIRVLGGNQVAIEETFSSDVIDGLIKKGHERVLGEKVPGDWRLEHSFARSFKGGAQAIWIDRERQTLIGASDSRLDGIPLGY